MSDYQAVFDAVNLNFSNGAHTLAVIAQEFGIAAEEMRRPSVLFRPALSKDGDQWCFLFGSDLQNGVAGFGETPALAAIDFDKAFTGRPQ